MRGDFIPPLAKIHLHHPSCIDGEPFVGVHHNTEQARVGVNELCLISGLQIPEDRCIIQESEVSHVLTLLKLRRVDLADFR